MDKIIANQKELEKIPSEKIMAAYALNVCTVSVSQIIDYNDLYILEQEYEAILNNLNLEMMPKDDALLKTLTEILNTITFFRIHELKKNQIEKEYQHNVKNAIWHAIPNLSVIVSGNPIAACVALATQVGIGYMNYRREKANILADKDKAYMELEITAIEQLNALRRELFTSAWKLADKYDFPDYLRLTEKQIKQYNQILFDTDTYRKYARLEAIQDNFLAYPPFWYNFAHTALDIATSSNDKSTIKLYKQKAEAHFKKFQKINSFNIFREDQITASAELEYVELLLLKSKPNYKEIKTHIDIALSKSGNSNDILQMCALAYVRIGETSSAEKLLKILVNEDYNTVPNAKILSRIYVSKMMLETDEDQRTQLDVDYNILKERVPNPIILYPLPPQAPSAIQVSLLENKFLATQKELLKKQFRLTLNEFKKKKIVDFNAVIPAPYNFTVDKAQYYSHKRSAEDQRQQDVKSALSGKKSSDFILRFKECGFREGYITVFNNTLVDMEKLNCFRSLKNHDDLVEHINKRIKSSRIELNEFQQKLNNEQFTYENYLNLCKLYSFSYFMEQFFDKTKDNIASLIDESKTLEDIDILETDLLEFCKKCELPNPEIYIEKDSDFANIETPKTLFFTFESIGINENMQQAIAITTALKTFVKDLFNDVIDNPTNAAVYFSDDKLFDSYFENRELRFYNASTYLVKPKTLAIIDDKTRKNYDLLICEDGIRLAANNLVKDVVPFEHISYHDVGKKAELELGYPEIYSNKNINIGLLYNAIETISKKIKEIKPTK